MTKKQRSLLQRLFKRRHGVLPTRRRRRTLLSEALEQRQLLAGDTLVQIIDDADAAFATTGTFLQNSGGYGGSLRQSSGAAQASTASWTVDVSPGTYQVAATWIARPEHAIDTPFTVYDGASGPSLANGSLDQTIEPNDFVDDSTWWEELGQLTVTGNTIVVEVTNAVGSGLAIADAIRVQRIPTNPAVDRPEAKHDRYLSTTGQALQIAAPGYLANDTQVGGDDVTTQIISRPRFGTLTLGTDGSFDYQPFPGFSGVDSFRYQVSNAAGQSNPVTVELEVADAPAVLTLADKPNVITVDVFFDQPNDGFTSLREAIELANTNGFSKNVIEFNLPPGNDIQVHQIDGPLVITSNVEIRGPENGSQRIVAQGQTGVLRVDAGGQAVLKNLTIANGLLPTGDGGGIWNAGELTLNQVHVTENQSASGRGGGIFNASGGTLALLDSTVSSNDASTDGGGIFNAVGASFDIVNSTVSDNTAGLWGGGIYTQAAGSLAASTVVHNQAVRGANLASIETMDVSNTILALGVNSSDVEGIVVSLGGNLVGNGDDATGFVAGDLVGSTASTIDPLLGALQDNGGPTPTHMLLPGSPAIDAGNSVHRFRDQRGADRVVDGLDANDLGDAVEQVDIGAVEFGTFFTNTFDDAIDTTPLGDGRVDVDPATPGDQVSLRGAIQELNALAGHGNTAGLGSGSFEGAVAFDELDYHQFNLDIQGAGEDFAASGDLDVYGNLSIHGVLESYDRPLTTINGGWIAGLRYNQHQQVGMHDRLFHVHPGAELDLSALKLWGGQADIGDGRGGAILGEQATVFATDVDIESNVAQRGGAIATVGGMTVVDSQSLIDENYASGGGGFYLDGGLLNIDDSRVSNNTGAVGGGGVYLQDGDCIRTNHTSIVVTRH